MAGTPVYELVDSNGNVVGELNHDVANSVLELNNADTGTEIQIKNGEVDYQSNDATNIGAVSTEVLNLGSVDKHPSVDKTTSSGTAPLILDFGGTNNSPSITYWGYNYESGGQRIDQNEHGGALSFEGEFVNADGDTNTEMNLDVIDDQGNDQRFLAFQWDVTNDEANWNLGFDGTINFVDGSIGSGSNAVQILSSGVGLPDEQLLQFGGDKDFWFTLDVGGGGSVNILRLRAQEDGTNSTNDVWNIERGTSIMKYNYDHDHKGNRIYGIRSSSTALGAGDLNNGEIALDEANDRIVWKDGNGDAYYASGTAL